MLEDINILFLGGAKRVSIAERFIEAGARFNKKVNIFSYELNSNVPISFLGKVIHGLKWSDADIIKDLIEVIRKNNIKILIPFLDPATLTAAKLKEKIGDEVFIPVSDNASCDIFFDKIKANKWFEESGLPVPSNNKYPRIAKPRRGSASKGIVVINNEIELKDFIQNNPNYSEEFLIQEFINAAEFSVDCYIDRSGKAISVVPRIRIETLGGEAVKSKTVRDSSIIELSREMLSKANLTGPITIQFLKDKNGKCYFMEINPRLGGGVVTSIGAGADITEMIIKEFLNLPLSPVDDWKDNTLMIRAFREYFRYADNS